MVQPEVSGVRGWETAVSGHRKHRSYRTEVEKNQAIILAVVAGTMFQAQRARRFQVSRS